MANRGDVIAAGYLDRLIARIGTVGRAQISPTNKAYLEIVRKTREDSPFDVRGGFGAFREVAEEARAAVNRARRAGLSDPGSIGPAPSDVPPADPSRARGSRSIEYHVIVGAYDPVTGGEYRGRVVVTATGAITGDRVQDGAEEIARQRIRDNDSPTTGEIKADRAVVSEVIVIGIVGRR